MNVFYYILAALLVATVVCVVMMAGRAAKKGRRYIGTDSPPGRFDGEDPNESAVSGIAGSFTPPGVRANFPGWIDRIRWQARTKEERKEERLFEEKDGRGR